MIRKQLKRFVTLVVIILSVGSLFGEGYAAGPEVTLVINPKETEIYAGAENIVITVDASGANLTFEWKLSGPGKLESEGAAAFYSPPEKIEQSSEFAIITVTVQEPSGQATIKSVTFTILPKPPKTPTPAPAPTPTAKKNLSRGTKIALGAGAVTAIGGGIALVVGGAGEDTPSCVSECAGVMVGCYCWYLGAEDQSCTSVCASHGGYHKATRTYAGSEGTNNNCWAVLSALGAPADSDGHLVIESGGYSLGCFYTSYEGGVWWQRDKYHTTAEAMKDYDAYGYTNRACACMR